MTPNQLAMLQEMLNYLNAAYESLSEARDLGHVPDFIDGHARVLTVLVNNVTDDLAPLNIYPQEV